MDLSPFKAFFTSLSEISRFDLDVWNKEGCLFSSSRKDVQTTMVEPIRDLTVQIIDEERFGQASSEKGYVICGVPIRDEDAVIGALIAHGPELHDRGQAQKRQSDGSTPEKAMKAFLDHTVELMGEMWVSEKETDEMAEDLSMYFEDLSLYSRAAVQFRTLNFSDTMLKEIATELLETMRTDLVFVKFPERQEFNMMLSDEKIGDRLSNPADFAETLISLIPPAASSLADNYFVINNSKENPSFGDLHADPFRFLAVTVQDKEKFYGWVGLLSFNLAEIFRRSELSLISSIAQQLATTISNSDLYKDLEDFVVSVVKSLVYTIEAKDVYTRGHSERVNYFSMQMAEQMELDEKTKDMLNWASILHDIGKIGIPEEILNKPGKLTDAEYDIIKSHPEKGRNILEPLKQLSGSVPGIFHHHERNDGKGYPLGLAGDEIPLEARIIAVADTFDAINSSRAYRPAKTPKDALDILEAVAGEQLDAELVEIFKKVYYDTFSLKGKGKGNNGSRWSRD